MSRRFCETWEAYVRKLLLALVNEAQLKNPASAADTGQVFVVIGPEHS